MSDTYHPPRPFNRTSRYGWRIDPVTGKLKFHAGEDWAAPEGTPIPTATPGVGNTGRFSRGNHLHYSTITTGIPKSKGEIGFNIDEEHTTDPALFDTAIRYPNETLQAGRAMFGPNDTSDALAFGSRRSPLTNASPFHQFGFRPSDNTPFADRFGNWTSSENGISAPAAEPRGLPALIVDQIRRQDERGPSAPPPPVSGAQQPVPFLPDDSDGSFADRFGDRPPIRRLSSWVRPR